jgi:hypothetical protein
VYVFGGWDGKGRFNDLHTLSLAPGGSGSGSSSAHASGAGAGACAGIDGDAGISNASSSPAATSSAATAIGAGACAWHWQEVKPRSPALPPPRADHSTCLWHYCDDGVWKDLLVVFGGSTQRGVCSDLWLYDTRCGWHQTSSMMFTALCITQLSTRRASWSHQ